MNTSGYTCSTRKCLILNTSFKSANIGLLFFLIKDLNKINICSIRKNLMVTIEWRNCFNINSLSITYNETKMRNTSVDKKGLRKLFLKRRKIKFSNIISNIHLNKKLLFLLLNHKGSFHCFYTIFILFFHMIIKIANKTTKSISAHLSFKTIGIKDPHGSIKTRFLTDDYYPISTNAKAPMTKVHNALLIPMEVSFLDEDKIVSIT